MIERSDPRLVKRLSVFAAAAAVFSTAVGLAGLCGTAFHILILTTWGAGPVTMKANTCTGFVLLGISLWSQRKQNASHLGNLAAKISAIAISLLGLLELAEHLFQRSLGIDQLLLIAPSGTANWRAGLMSPITAACFLVLGLALTGLDWRTSGGRWPAQFLSLSAGLAAIFGILSFAFDPHIYVAHLSLALPTAVTFAFFSLGLVCARTDWGLGALMCSQSLGGSLARRLLPAAFIPAFVGWLRWQVTAAGLYSEWSIVVFSTMTTMSLLAGVIAWAAVAVDRNDVDRRKVEEALAVSEEQLNRLLNRLDEPPAETLLRRKTTIRIGVAVLLLSVLGFFTWRSAERAQADADWVSHTQEVLRNLEITQENLVDIETGGRMFAISGQTPFLATYEAGLHAIAPNLAVLRQLTLDNPNQQQRLNLLSAQINTKIAASKRLVEARRSGKIPTALQIERGRNLVDASRATILQMEDEEQRLLNQRVEKTHEARRVTLSVVLLGSVLTVAFLLTAGAAVNRQIGVSAQARAQVNALNTELERRVEERTGALAAQTADLTHSQHALGAQTALLQSVLDSMGEGLAAADEHGEFILWNPAAEKILGLSAVKIPSAEWSQYYGMFFPDGITPYPPEQLPLARAIRGETCTVELFVRNEARPDGGWIEVNAHPLKDAEGQHHGGVAAIRDITENKIAAREIQELNEVLENRVAERTAQLEEANKELESFTYSVAHDLRAPLRHIAGFSGILMEEFYSSLDEQAQGYLRRIQDGTRKMGQLVDELLSLARVGRQEPHFQQAGLNSIVQEVIEILQPEIEGRQVEWKIAALPFIECDPTLLKQVFQNLIANALKYSRPRALAVIEIGQTTIDQGDGRSAFFVRDNGVGFSMKYADKLFGVFQRLHRSEDFEGTGVGLATVQRIIKKHQGRAWAQAELDKGATFYFTVGWMPTAQTETQAIAMGA
ncbi:MAG TPA: CHASE3 domain-containing protein [Terriglobales bacterium]|nr:CHASE3 domain-containing protein [Terriglobales bacterium]